MASPQFLELLNQLYETGEQKLLRWEPLKRSPYSSRCDFCIALGSGVIHVSSNEDDEETWGANYKVKLLTRDGLLVDEIETSQIEGHYDTFIRDLFRQARSAAFNLPRMVEEMRSDLFAGRTRELPKDLLKSDDDTEVPF
jgi:hypothetical protein